MELNHIETIIQCCQCLLMIDNSGQIVDLIHNNKWLIKKVNDNNFIMNFIRISGPQGIQWYQIQDRAMQQSLTPIL